MVEHDLNINQRIAKHVREQRMTRGLSLDGLAEKTGVSRSMISLIERGETSPTAVVLEKLAAGLNVTLASLFEEPAKDDTVDSEPIARRKEQLEWKDPESGYRRRNVTPAWLPQPMQIVEVTFPAGKRVAFDAGPRDQHVFQQIWILEGAMEITAGDNQYRLNEGDCLAMQLGEPTTFRNPTRKAARYVVVISRELSGKRA